MVAERDDPYTAYCLDTACVRFGRYVENELARVSVTDPEEIKRRAEVTARRQRRLHEILYGDIGTSSAIGPVLINDVYVEGRTRLPQADDPEDPYGLWDKAPPPAPPPGRYRDVDPTKVTVIKKAR